MTGPELLELFRYDRWANGRMLQAATELSEGELKQPLHTSFESVLGTLRHVLWSEWVWLGRWTPAPQKAGNPLSCRDLGDLKSCWTAFEAEQQEFLATLRDSDFGRVVSYENPPGTAWSYSLSHMLQHVVNHSTYHRGQVVALLRQLSKTPPPTDFLDFLDETGGNR